MAAPVVDRAEAPTCSLPPPGHTGSRVFGLCLALAFAGLVRAETLIDPTRSPLGNRGAGGDSAATEVEASPSAPTRVQMIVRGPGETRVAVIDGNNVRVGDTVRLRTGTARVESITDTSVVLAAASGRETLQLLPGMERSVRCARRPEAQLPGGC
jgi:hypothetical protein